LGYFLDTGFGSHSRGELKLGHKFPDIDAPSSSFDEVCNRYPPTKQLQIFSVSFIWLV